jgi:hypothetical protein
MECWNDGIVEIRATCLRRSGSRLREAPASAGVGRSRRQAEVAPTPFT